jgi:nucleoid DNA-binding protein
MGSDERRCENSQFVKNVQARVNENRNEFRRLSQKDVQRVLNAIKEELEENIRTGMTVVWHRLGIFAPRFYQNDNHYRPETGTTEKMSLRVSMKFSPARSLRERLNEPVS